MKCCPKVIWLVPAMLGLSLPGVGVGVVPARAELLAGANERILLDRDMLGAHEKARSERAAIERDTLQRSVIQRGVIQTGTIQKSAIQRSAMQRGTIQRGTIEPVHAPLVLGESIHLVSRTKLAAGRFDPAPLTAAVLREANATRHEHGSGLLVTDAALDRAALGYARELASRGEVEHLSPTPGLRTFRDRFEAAGARAQVGGENLARLTATPESLGGRVVQAWLRSPGHKMNLLDPIFSRTGIGVWLGGDGVWYVVQVYATAS